MRKYRPISNLPFISKRIEKKVARRVAEHLDNNNIHHIYKSVYRNDI